MNSLSIKAALSLAILFQSHLSVAQTSTQPPDPHRPACTNVQCKKAKAFTKSHYCGASPFANGPDDGCDTRAVPKASETVHVMADYDCARNEVTTKCQQRGKPSSDVQTILIREMRRLGLPPEADKSLNFVVWQHKSTNWLFAEAIYQNTVGDDLTIAEVILVIRPGNDVQVLRELPLTKADADVPTVTTWDPVDLADTLGNGQIDITLLANAYENHWFEVDVPTDGVFKTIFSGLGYYL
jgi:hypothetical protein